MFLWKHGHTTLAKKIVTAEKFMRLIHSSIMWYRAISSFGSTSTRLAASAAARRELALQIEVDVVWYHMIALWINLMNISAVTIFLARVVVAPKAWLEVTCVYDIILSKTQWTPFWLAAQLYPPNDWAGWQFCVNYELGRIRVGPIEFGVRNIIQ